MSPKETKIYNMTVQGMRNKAIAQQLKVKEKTVKWHLTNIYKDHGVTSRAELLKLHWQNSMVNVITMAFPDLDKSKLTELVRGA